MQYFAPTLLERQVFTTPGAGTWVNRFSGGLVRVRIVAGGTGGASGRRGVAGGIRGGGGGGAGGWYLDIWLLGAELAATVPLLVGAAGLGGAAVTADDTNGNPGGNTGVLSSFGPSNMFLASLAFQTCTGGTQGGGGQGAGYNYSADSARFGSGGNGGAGSSTPTMPGPGLHDMLMFPGGPGGGSISAAEAVFNGASGAMVPGQFIASPGAAGTAPGGNGGAGQVTQANLNAIKYGVILGASGGGGASSVTGTGGDGGLPGGFGVGGAGGGASINGNNSGKGGDGGTGIIVVEVFS